MRRPRDRTPSHAAPAAKYRRRTTRQGGAGVVAVVAVAAEKEEASAVGKAEGKLAEMEVATATCRAQPRQRRRGAIY